MAEAAHDQPLAVEPDLVEGTAARQLARGPDRVGVGTEAHREQSLTIVAVNGEHALVRLDDLVGVRELGQARIWLRLEAANEDSFDGPRRQFPVPKGTADRLGVGDGDLVELVAPRGVNVRGWTRLAADGDDETLMLGPSGLSLLNAAPGAAVEVRAVRALPGA